MLRESESNPQIENFRGSGEYCQNHHSNLQHLHGAIEGVFHKAIDHAVVYTAIFLIVVGVLVTIMIAEQTLDSTLVAIFYEFLDQGVPIP